MTLDGKVLRGLFEHERLKSPIIRTGKCIEFAAVKTSNEYRN